jgi:hypothetical protein
MIFVHTSVDVEAETKVSRGVTKTELGHDVPRQTSISIGQYRSDHSLKVTIKMKYNRTSHDPSATLLIGQGQRRMLSSCCLILCLSGV